MNVSTEKQLCALSLRNAQRQNFSKSFVCSILTSSSNWLFIKETHGVIARRCSEAVAI
jgi:hypothetical protein